MAGRRMQMLGFSGNLRREPYNTRLLLHFAGALPQDVRFSQAGIGDVPLFDADVVQSDGFPAPVSRLIKDARSADAIVFAIPEYNYSIPGVLKNAIAIGLVADLAAALLKWKERLAPERAQAAARDAAAS